MQPFKSELYSLKTVSIPSSSIICSLFLAPIAFSTSVTGSFFLLSILAVTSSFSDSGMAKSSQAPRSGINFAEQPSAECVKYIPADLASWFITTRSVPLMMNVPRSVITGNSPRNISLASFLTCVLVFVSLIVAFIDIAHVISFCLASSSVILGLSIE